MMAVSHIFHYKSIFIYRFIYASNIVWKKEGILYIKMCMINKQCNYSILLLLYDFECENVEIKQTWNLKIFFFYRDLSCNLL